MSPGRQPGHHRGGETADPVVDGHGTKDGYSEATRVSKRGVDSSGPALVESVEGYISLNVGESAVSEAKMRTKPSSGPQKPAAAPGKAGYANQTMIDMLARAAMGADVYVNRETIDAAVAMSARVNKQQTVQPPSRGGTIDVAAAVSANANVNDLQTAQPPSKGGTIDTDVAVSVNVNKIHQQTSQPPSRGTAF